MHAVQTLKAVIGEAGAPAGLLTSREIPSEGFGPQSLQVTTRVQVPLGPSNSAGVGSSRLGDERDRGADTPRGPRANPAAANSSTTSGPKGLASQTGRRREAEPRRGQSGWVRGRFSLRSPEIGRLTAAGNCARPGGRDMPLWFWGNTPSDVTGRSTPMTNLGRSPAAGVVPRCPADVRRVVETLETGSGGRVGAGGSRAESGQGSPGSVGVLRVVPGTRDTAARSQPNPRRKP
jgi:hypothetical protein